MKVLLLVNGLGLGNSTRCHGVIQRLRDRNARIRIVTSGNGLWYFKNSPDIEQVYQTGSLHYGADNGSISISRTLASVGTALATLRSNAKMLDDILEDYRPDVVVTDSDYVFAPIRQRSIPLVALNNADVVRANYRRFGDAPSSVRAQYYCVETPDAIYHRLVPDLVISPTMMPDRHSDVANIVHVGPIVRKGFIAERATGVGGDRAVIMLSGSHFGTPVEMERNILGLPVDIVGRDMPEGLAPDSSIRYLGKVTETLPLLESARAVVVNGGFSAVSEVFCLRKPMVVLPVPRHAEQWSNAREIEELGVGIMGAEETYIDDLTRLLADYDRFDGACCQMAPPADGASAAADIILSLARQNAS
ncbi:MAG: glycosyltransferase family protein [Rhodospirillales bacterium]